MKDAVSIKGGDGTVLAASLIWVKQVGGLMTMNI
jgi:hypothetical protein